MYKLAIPFVVFATACMLPAQSPKGGVVATGEQLNVVDDVKVWTTTSKEKVAETEYKDSTGAVVGTGAVYQNKETTHTMKIWYPVQGAQQLADEDFFRIAGDPNALSETERLRENGKKWNHRGIGLMIGGIVGMIGGYLVPNDTARTVLLIGGGLTATGGYYAAWWGAHQMNPETHAVDRSVAERAAQQYNSSLGHTVGLNVGKSF